MDIKELDLNGGTFKASFPYHWIGWLVWVIGLLITLFGFVVAINETVALLIAAIGLVVMSLATPGSLQGSLHKIRQNAIDPTELQAKADASGLSIDNWWMQQTSYVPTNDPSDWILPAPGPTTWDNSNRYGPHGDGSPLPEHPVKVGTPTPATMTMVTVYMSVAIVCLLIALSAMMSVSYTHLTLPTN